MRLRMLLLCTALCLAMTSLATAQESRGKASATIHGKTVVIEYGRPALKGRTFDSLMSQLPSDRIWRAGSGILTTLSTEGPLTLGGKKVAAGKYSVYVHCAEQGDYSLVLNKDLGQPLIKVFDKAPPDHANDPYPHFEYQKEIGDQEVVRVPMKKADASGTDVFTITLTPNANGAVMQMSWGDRSWTVDLGGQ